MGLDQQISADLTAAMKARDRDAARTLRSVRAAIVNLRVAEGRDGTDPTDEEVTDLIVREAKSRRESIEAYRGAGRDDLAAREEAELAILQRYLPAPLSSAELRAIVDEVIAQTGASGPSELGKVMGPVMGRVKGRADGKEVNALVRQALSG